MFTTTTRSLIATGTLAAVLLTGACSADESGDHATGSSEPASAPDRADADDGAAMVEEDQAPGAGEAGEVADAAQPGNRVPERAAEVDDEAVISTGTIELEADDVARARFDVQKVVDNHGGTISQQETTTADDGDLDTARMVLRIPSEDFEAATAQLEEIGVFLESSYGSEIVTTEVIDVDARVRAQTQSVARIEALLAEAEDLQELMAIESELSRRQAELDSLKSRQQWLADQTSMATVTVYVERTEEPGEEKETDRAGFLGGLQSGWDSFTTALVGTAAVVGFLLPWLGLALLVGATIWLLLRLSRRTPKAPVATD